MVQFYNSLKQEINWYEAGLLVDMLNRTWNTGTTMGQFRERAVSGSPLFVADDMLAEKDVFCMSYPLLCSGKVMPVGLVETLAIRTGGIYENVPRDYRSLTNGGWWNKITGEEDTLLFVDVTTLETRRGTGLGNELMQYALRWTRKNKDYRYLWTYTPNIDKVIKWHESLGAKNTGCVIKDARPQFNVHDVVIMEYSDKRRFYYTCYK